MRFKNSFNNLHGSHAEYSSKTSVEFASKGSETPHSSVEAVVNERRELSYHHAQIYGVEVIKIDLNLEKK